MKKVMRPVMSLLFAAVALVGGAGVASADVIVGPGQAGHVCSGYAYVTTNPNRYFQTCAWADGDEVWFTANFGNASGTNWDVDYTAVGFWRSGVFYNCTVVGIAGFDVPAHSTRSTAKYDCAYVRVRAAYQAYTYVEDGSWAGSRASDSLQVQ